MRKQPLSAEVVGAARAYVGGMCWHGGDAFRRRRIRDTLRRLLEVDDARRDKFVADVLACLERSHITLAEAQAIRFDPSQPEQVVSLRQFVRMPSGQMIFVP